MAPSPPQATGRSGEQCGHDALDEDVQHILRLNRARHGVPKQEEIPAALPGPGREEKAAEESNQDEDDGQAKRGDREAENARHHDLQQGVDSLRLELL